ncbi:MAG: ABC transporter permease [Verrucomicrobiae bacterium]|nr:ABC transporter permease [Verrucomicrobiae bacterium]
MTPWLENLIVIGGLAILIATLWIWAHSDRWQRAWQRFRRDRLGIASLGIIAFYLLVGLMASLRLPAPAHGQACPTILDRLFSGVPKEKSYSAPFADTTYSVNRPEPLKGRHPLGTDVLGKDVLLQTAKACRTALIIAGLTSLIYIPLGTLLGIVAGYFRRWVDDIIQYVYITLASIPNILLLVAILMVLGKGLSQMAIALGITSWVGLCRLIRGESMRQATRPYVEAARALGHGPWVIITRHILPNVMHLVIINLVLGFSGLVLSESILSYIGVGAPVGTPSWGLMIDSARMELSREPVVWWYLVSATGALFFLVLSLNLLGDALRRAFDPKSS